MLHLDCSAACEDPPDMVWSAGCTLACYMPIGLACGAVTRSFMGERQVRALGLAPRAVLGEPAPSTAAMSHRALGGTGNNTRHAGASVASGSVVVSTVRLRRPLPERAMPRYSQ